MLADLIARIEAEPGRRAELVRAYAAQVGAPTSRVHRQLRAAGCGSGRRRRSDAGSTRADGGALEQVAAMQVAAVRRSGQPTLYLPVARQIAEQGGEDLGGLSTSQVARLLRDRGMDLRTQRRGRRTHADIRSGGPNVLHLMDPSRALVWYLPSASRGRRQRSVGDDGWEPYKNKPMPMEGRKARLGVWRYVLVDHASGCLAVRYYEQAGENPEATWDFLCWAWHRDRPWHGLPEWLWWDKGSEAAPIRAALQALGIRHYAHAPGNSRAKGVVERAQRIVETSFESRLGLQPADSIDELNERAERWCGAFNAGAVGGLDTRLRRPGLCAARMELWQRIRAEELRELPEEALDLAVWQPAQRKVAGNLTISYAHPRLRAQARYRVGSLPGIRVGELITVQPLLAGGGRGAVIVSRTWRGERVEERVQPREYDEYGQPLDGASPGEFRQPEATEVERTGERLRELAGPVRPGQAAFGGRYRALDAAEAGDRTVLQMPRRGEAVEVEPAPAAEVLSLADAGRYARQAMGAAWRPESFARLAERWPRGASTAELDAWAAEERGGREAAG